ncbi:hypothetical protein AB0O16_06770 [Microbacterium sp. NPDC089180]|uniref:hypothetical protein n=1 Tax=unclassified Microbacterium TaxID=2609290 RepID=UPI003430DFA3
MDELEGLMSRSAVEQIPTNCPIDETEQQVRALARLAERRKRQMPQCRLVGPVKLYDFLKLVLSVR